MTDETTTTTPATVQTLAKEAAGWFTTTTRHDNETITVTRDGRPEWLTDLIRKAHRDGDMLPDDWRYAAIREALDAIAEADDLDDAETEFAEDVDVYTSELTGWLHSRNDRGGYIDEARQEFGRGIGETFEDDLKAGQMMERREIFQSVHASLVALVDERDDENA